MSPSISDTKPSVLILGGLQDGHARALLAYLVPSITDPAQQSARHIRLVDKYLCLPQDDAYTTYMDSECQKVLKAGESIGVEYLQANLLVASSRSKAFTLPEQYRAESGGGGSETYDYVFDFTGETDYNAEEGVHIERTGRLLPELGRVAAAMGVKAYVRELPALYHSDNKKPLKEGEGKPFSMRSKWVHEGVRAMAALPDLNIVVARPALLYGPYAVDGYAPRLLIGEIYKYIGERMEHLWSSELRLHTIHTHDFAAGLWALAGWMSGLGRAAAEGYANPIPCLLPAAEQLPAGMPARDQLVKAPFFNLVDDGDTTQGLMASIAEKVVGVKVGFYNKVVCQFAKLNMIDVIEDVNEKHCEPWPEMLSKSNPPITNTPFTPNLPRALLTKNHIAFDGSKIKEIVGFKVNFPEMTEEVIRDQVQKFILDGVWPNAPPKKSS
ncbi:hypothetical protein PTTG_00115 [Puccinia triticina 1-1 BBBD Race 1]|uniref:NAD-dependent epimerase/dehydratase domain-containing protein n=2 Tax=Puccinia triticina TaxID=208348 RepID=A0A180GX55_PUCT1|nr:uncharacterized protein PtA15_9A682 [Puccinia triticina]OAV97375.1 hypothetical protein PTTG_00115 [Puccinia triticina 1-1 BBBD Race 1]WAQ88555.1 hypothetical protein PtA15_9A682 [Puccinia triticina]